MILIVENDNPDCDEIAERKKIIPICNVLINFFLPEFIAWSAKLNT